MLLVQLALLAIILGTLWGHVASSLVDLFIVASPLDPFTVVDYRKQVSLVHEIMSLDLLSNFLVDKSVRYIYVTSLNRASHISVCNPEKLELGVMTRLGCILTLWANIDCRVFF